MIKGIKTNLVDTFLANMSGSAALCDGFSAAARHVSDFIVIMKSCGPGINNNILGIDTDKGGGGGWGRVGGTRRGLQGRGGGRSRRRLGHEVTPQDMVDACTHITKSYYTESIPRRPLFLHAISFE